MSSKHFAATLLLPLLSVLAFLGVSEGVLRVYAHVENQRLLTPFFDKGVEVPSDRNANLGHVIRPAKNPRIVYELKPNLSVNFAGTPMSTNSMGFRSGEIGRERAKRSYRIVGIGDSFMFGKGVGDDETYLAVLERLLQKQFVEISIQVINTAVPDYNTVMEVETLKDKALQLKPDLVIIEWVGNDINLPNFVQARRNVLALDQSFLAGFVRRRFTNNNSENIYLAALRNAGLLKTPKTNRGAPEPERVPPSTAISSAGRRIREPWRN